jgi:hypothetical protein
MRKQEQPPDAAALRQISDQLVERPAIQDTK